MSGTLIINLQANEKAWEANATTESVRCQGKCHAVYPGRLMAKVKDGICEECREKGVI